MEERGFAHEERKDIPTMLGQHMRSRKAATMREFTTPLEGISTDGDSPSSSSHNGYSNDNSPYSVPPIPSYQTIHASLPRRFYNWFLSPFLWLGERLRLRDIQNDMKVEKKEDKQRRRWQKALLFLVLTLAALGVVYKNYHAWNAYYSSLIEGGVGWQDHKQCIDMDELQPEQWVVPVAHADPKGEKNKPKELTVVSPYAFYPTFFFHDQPDGSELPLYETEEQFEMFASSCTEVSTMEMELDMTIVYTNATHQVTEPISKTFENLGEFVTTHNHSGHARWWTFACTNMFLPKQPGWHHPCLCVAEWEGKLANMANLKLKNEPANNSITYLLKEKVGYIAELRNKNIDTRIVIPLSFSYMTGRGTLTEGSITSVDLAHRFTDVVRIMRGTMAPWTETSHQQLPPRKFTFEKPKPPPVVTPQQ